MQNNNKSYKIVIIEPSMIISTGLRKLIEMRNEFERERGLRGFVAFFRPTFIDKGGKKCYTAKSYKTVTKLQIGYKDRSESDGRSYGRSRLPRTPAAPCG